MMACVCVCVCVHLFPCTTGREAVPSGPRGQPDHGCAEPSGHPPHVPRGGSTHHGGRSLATHLQRAVKELGQHRRPGVGAREGGSGVRAFSRTLGQHCSPRRQHHRPVGHVPVQDVASIDACRARAHTKHGGKPPRHGVLHRWPAVRVCRAGTLGNVRTQLSTLTTLACRTCDLSARSCLLSSKLAWPTAPCQYASPPSR